jgi:hypothetical protein
VAVDDLVEAQLKGVEVERAGETKDGRDVVEGGGGSELIKEPEALLSKRYRSILELRAPGNSQRWRRARGSTLKPLGKNSPLCIREIRA